MRKLIPLSLTNCPNVKPVTSSTTTTESAGGSCRGPVAVCQRAASRALGRKGGEVQLTNAQEGGRAGNIA